MDIFTQVRTSLEPYIRSRQEVEHIRRVLACQLDSNFDQKIGDPKSAALSLPNESTVLKHSTGNVRGLRKEYLRSLRANIKARREFNALELSIASPDGELVSQRPGSTGNGQGLVSETYDYLDSYLALVKQRQRLERLRILHDFSKGLSRKNAASASYLEEIFETESASLPRVPEDIIAARNRGTQQEAHSALKKFLRNLEKSVLHAKFQSQSEKQAFSQSKANPSRRQQQNPGASGRKADTLEALGRTRNELIAWVEQELSTTGDSELLDNEKGQTPSQSSAVSIDQHLARVRSQYAQYMEARQTFLDRTTNQVNAKEPAQPTSADDISEAESKENSVLMMRIVSPYLEELVLVSNEQKAVLQQRSHLTVSLSKQYKEATLLFDRLVDESHLLPAFPMPSSNLRKGGQPHPLSAEISGVELAGTTQRARAWTYAAESAATATMEAVLASTEGGSMAIEGARHEIMDLEKLLGQDGAAAEDEEGNIWISQESRQSKKQNQQYAGFNSDSKDIWASLDGQLGVIKNEDIGTP